jgi:hypothetical protein
MKTKFLIQITSSMPDIYGNRYSIAEVENLNTGKSLSVYMGWGGGDNIEWMLKCQGYGFDQIKTVRNEIGIRDFNRLPYDICEHEIMPKHWLSIGAKKRKGGDV